MTAKMKQNDTANQLTRHAPMLTIAITGGIASGKSFVCRQLVAAGQEVFDCDREAKRIIREDESVRRELTALVGDGLYDSDGQLVKPVLAAWICRGGECTEKVNAIVHPRVAEAFRKRCHEKEVLLQKSHLNHAEASMEHAEDLRQRLLANTSERPTPVAVETLKKLPAERTLFMECALLFETGFDRLTDLSVTVHVSRKTQLERLMARNQIGRAEAEAWLALQLAEDERMQRADLWIDNEASK